MNFKIAVDGDDKIFEVVDCATFEEFEKHINRIWPEIEKRQKKVKEKNEIF